MKKYLSILGAILMIAGCAKQEIKPVEEQVQDNTPEKGEVSFVAGFTKVTTDAGDNSWDSGDQISVFSVANSAAAGVSVSTNLAYETASGGASAVFNAAGDKVTASDKYYAYYPYQAAYAAKLNKNDDIGFTGAAANADVTDYRFFPVNINSGATFIFDPTTGESYSNNTFQFFYASADAPANDSDPVTLHFKPVLPLLEFDLYGYGTIKQVVVAFKEPATDVFAQNNWLSAKGVIDASTGVMTVTNQSASAYYKLNVTLKEDSKDYIELRGTEPMKMKLTVGHFNVTKGLSLTFTDKDGNSFTKNIWTDKTVSSVTDAGAVKHIRQGINVPYVKASVSSVDEFPAEGGAAAAFTILANSDWTVESKPDWISLSTSSGTGGESVTLTAEANSGAARSGAVVFKTTEGAKYSVAVSQAKFVAAAAAYYSVDVTAIDFATSYIYDVKNSSDELIARITKEYLGADKDVQVNVAYPAPSGTPTYTNGLVLDNGGSVNAYTLTPTAVSYTAGSSSALSTIWVKADGSAIYTATPSGTIAAASVSPYTLTSPSGEINAIVKVGSKIWVTKGYKSTKLANGNDLTVLTSGFSAQSSPAVIISSDGKWLFNGHAIKENFAPSGWKLPEEGDWTDFCTFVGSYANVTKSYLFDRTTWKLNGTALADLGYYNTWSDTANGTKWYMLMWKNGASPTKNGQAMTAMFEVRLIKN
ncbi:MAG: hypothetical protein K6A64_09775 [Bacteroidales bacterium]|nr:hypothetical protein [Bacteroidales bacterium]